MPRYLSPRGIQVIRWLLLLVAFSVALLYLNGALFSFWAAGGPPTPYPEAYLQQGLRRTSYAFAIALCGFAAFRQLSRLSRIDRLALCCVGLATVVFCIPIARAYFATDACLDSGGRWNQLVYRCER